MNVGTMTDNQPKAAITVSRMCSLLEMSRSQFYWHVRKGTFHAPLKLSNGRPYYNASQVEDNLKARELGIGVKQRGIGGCRLLNRERCRQWLVLDAHKFRRLDRCIPVDRRHCSDRVTAVKRFATGDDVFSLPLRFTRCSFRQDWKISWPNRRQDTGHRHRPREIDALDHRMCVRAPDNFAPGVVRD